MSGNEGQVAPAGPGNDPRLDAVLRKRPELRGTPSPEGRVKVLEAIGKGNFGFVYKGLVKGTGGEDQLSALKVVCLKESELREILLEVQILKECSHANIVRYFGCFMKGLDLWIAMEFCGGGSVDSIYNNYPKALSDESIAVLLSESLKGLDYFHQTQHIHRDIKAGNILLSENGEVKLADFGVSAKLSSRKPLAHSFIGTPYWMAPEVIASEENYSNLYDTKVDIWSIGIMTIEIADKAPPLADIHPFTALKLIMSGKACLELKDSKRRSKQMADFIQTCTIRDPRRRPTAQDLLAHPFLQRAEKLKKRELMANLLAKARGAKAKGRMEGNEDDSDDVDDGYKYALSEIRPISDSEDETTGAQHWHSKAFGQAPSAPPEPLLYANVNDLRSGEFLLEFRESVKLADEVTSGDFLFPYLLLATDQGLLVSEMQEGTRPRTTKDSTYVIKDVRFRQVRVLEDYGVLIARCGKKDRIRQYRLSSIRKLIRLRLGLMTEATLTTTAGSFRNHGTKRERDDDEAAMDTTSLLRDYVKVTNTKDTLDFVVQRTAGSIFLLVLARSGLTLFEWAREPYNRFMKVRSFWVPETPKFMGLLHDGQFPREILAGYAQEANRIDTETSKVSDVAVHRSFTEKPAPRGKEKRWHTFDQLPLESNAYATIKQTLRLNTAVNKKVAAAVSPYEKGKGSDSRALWRKAKFVATYGRRTRIVNIDGTPVPNTPVLDWSDMPIKLMTFPESGVIVGIFECSVRVVDIATGECMLEFLQPFDRQSPLATSGHVNASDKTPAFDTAAANEHSGSGSVYMRPENSIIGSSSSALVPLRFLAARNGMLCLAAHRRKRQSQIFLVSGLLPKPFLNAECSTRLRPLAGCQGGKVSTAPNPPEELRDMPPHIPTTPRPGSKGPEEFAEEARMKEKGADQVRRLIIHMQSSHIGGVPVGQDAHSPGHGEQAHNPVVLVRPAPLRQLDPAQTPHLPYHPNIDFGLKGDASQGPTHPAYQQQPLLPANHFHSPYYPYAFQCRPFPTPEPPHHSYQPQPYRVPKQFQAPPPPTRYVGGYGPVGSPSMPSNGRHGHQQSTPLYALEPEHQGTPISPGASLFDEGSPGGKNPPESPAANQAIDG